VRELALTSRFERAYRRFVKKDPSLQEPIERTLRSMSENLDEPRLRTHHLSGQLAGLYACSVATIAGLFSPNRKTQTREAISCCSLTSARTTKCIEYPAVTSSPAFDPRSRKLFRGVKGSARRNGCLGSDHLDFALSEPA
jgi:mRNA-degrading endonuclease YafQ of YafQ-DinJ toxin-antitoxin module